MARQTWVISISDKLARKVRAHLALDSAYIDLDEFVEVALGNQLTLDTGTHVSTTGSPSTGDTSPSLVEKRTRPGQESPAAKSTTRLDSFAAPDDLLSDVDRLDGPLLVLTNRLGPLKIALRVAAVLRERGGWPTLSEFQNEAATEARRFGLALRASDPPDARRWIAFPVGEDLEKAKLRYIRSFMLSERDGKSAGPLATLGLAGVCRGKVYLTHLGWRIAIEPSALDDQGAKLTLTKVEQTLFREALRNSTAEQSEIVKFLEAVRTAQGSMEELDRTLKVTYPSATGQLITAMRAAMIGRLSDAGVLEATGRGRAGSLRLLETTKDLETV